MIYNLCLISVNRSYLFDLLGDGGRNILARQYIWEKCVFHYIGLDYFLYPSTKTHAHSQFTKKSCAIDLIRLRSGHIVFLWNRSSFG